MVKNLIILLVSSALNKGFLLILPYIVSGEIYNEFNSLYYSATMLTVIAVFGLDFVAARKKYIPKPLFTAIVLNIILSFGLFSIITGEFNAEVLIFLVTNISFSLYTTFFLFKGDLKRYLVSSFCYFGTGLISIILSFLLSWPLFTIFSFISISLITGLKFVNFGDDQNNYKLSEIYISGGSIFLINALSGIVFSFDKYIVNNYLGIVNANAYTFAWTLLVPVFYIGNLFEKQIYTSKKEKTEYRDVAKIAAFNASSLFLYLVVVNSVILFFNLLPDSINKYTFSRISLMLSAGLFIFSCIHFPLNGVLLKYSSSRIQKLSGLINLALLVIFAGSILIALFSFSGGIGTIITISFAALIISALAKMLLVMDESRKTPFPDYQDI